MVRKVNMVIFVCRLVQEGLIFNGCDLIRLMGHEGVQ